MKSRYARFAILYDDGFLLTGYTDKYGFHPHNKSCGFGLQKFNKHDIGRIIFFSERDARTKYPNCQLIP